ncbi:MAG: MaoC family dehydratase N-terminal domain-containing protein [Desulfuromonadales bacterium]|jgi:acyl dehydratase|nr:MaoC family dehydratase N-terminal domain-containing protein [Gammaproteobacteria bacterium]MDH3923029.1 MaoC family dehydratase N-terminal domain-containing protein [Xanthomonadales bacterium]MDH3959717.1 MaoC family dehydratase N-terminal domain-containing protein [Desulfuromonadales bacterium]
MIDKKWIGEEVSNLSTDVEKGQLRFFARTVGETDPIYTDEDAARAAGYRSLPAPPTFLFSLNLAQSDPLGKYLKIGVDLARLLHGGQEFEYYKPICAGDRITLKSRVVDIVEKKGGALELLFEETTATNQHNELVGRMKQSLVIRHG